MNFKPGSLREKLNAQKLGAKVPADPIGQLGQSLRSVNWPEPSTSRMGNGTVVIPGGRAPRAPRAPRRLRPVGTRTT